MVSGKRTLPFRLVAVCALALAMGLLSPVAHGTAVAADCPRPTKVSEQLVPSCGVLWGAVANAFNKRPGWPSQGPTAHRRYEAATGRTVGAYAYYYRGSTGQTFPRPPEIGLSRESGKQRLLYMHWKIADDMTFADVAAGKADRRIDRQAAYLKANYTDKFFISLHSEMEPQVQQAPGSGRTAKDFAAMYRYVHDRMRSQGATNAVWVVAFMGYPRWATQSWFRDLYPGDGVVDWIAWDPYSSTDNGYQDFKTLLNSTLDSRDGSYRGMYNYLRAQHPGKPLMLSEYGVFHTPGKPGAVPTRKADFYRSVAAQLDQFPAVKMMMNFDTEFDDFNNNGFDISVFNNPTNLAAFKSLSADPRLVNPTTTGGFAPPPVIGPDPPATAPPATVPPAPGPPGGPPPPPPAGPVAGGPADPGDGQAGGTLAPPAKVRALKVKKTTPKTVKVKYKKSAGADKYKFWAKAKKGSKKQKKWTAKGTTKKAKYTVAKLKPKTKYRIRVVAMNEAGSSPKSYVNAKTKRRK